MNLDRGSALELVRAVRQAAGSNAAVDVAFFPPFVYLEAVREACGGSALRVGAQNANAHVDGAYTGEVSVPMLKDIGIDWVLLGHSERRHVFGESLEDIHAKVRTALDGGFEVMLCIGETLEEREAERTEAVCAEQLTTALDGVSRAELARISLAYEPVWAIGTGKVATPDQAQSIHAFLRGELAKSFDDSGAQATRILYGGSVKS